MSEIIVVAEDDMLVSMLMEDILSEHGYSVVLADTADAALIELDRHRDVAAVLTDIDMPGTMNGLELAAKLSVTRPGLPVIVVSGKHRPNAAALGEAKFLAKPFLGDELISIVNGIVAQ